MAVAGELRTVGTRTYQLDGGVWWLIDGADSWEVTGQQVVIEHESVLSEAEVDTLLSELGLDVRYRADWGPYCHLAVPDTSDPIDITSLCLSADGVEDAWADTKVRWAAAPSDSFYARRIGIPDDDYNEDPWWRQWNLRFIDAEAAWDIEVGDTTVVIAMLDTGIQLDHDDLRGNLWINWDEYYGEPGSSDDDNEYIDDVYGLNVDDLSGDVGGDIGHGVWVAGLIAAQTCNDSTGIAGLAGGWYGDVQWVPGMRGSGCLIMTLAAPIGGAASLVPGLIYAVDMGADVASMSFGCAQTTQWDAAIDEAIAAGMVLVAATGNGGGALLFPASDPDVIAVGATDRRDYRVWYSNCGEELDVLAPSGACAQYGKRCGGEDDTTTCHARFTDVPPAESEYLYWDGGDFCVYDSLFLWSTGSGTVEDGYDHFGGTSGATPQVAALAGLLKSYDSTLTAAEIRDLIRSSAEDQIGDDTDGLGYDIYYGYGRINAYAALFLARGGGATTTNLRLCHDVEFDRDVKISAGDTLTLLPDVTVTFASGSDAANLGVDANRCELIVEGTLIAEGINADTLVTFTSAVDSAGAWYGIRAPADTGVINMEYCAVENAYKGISVENPDGLTISQVFIDDCVSHGIWCKECDSSDTVESCTITDPGLIGIEAIDCDGFVLTGHEISDATVYGIKCHDAVGMTVEENTILGASGESGFVGISYVCASGDTTLSIEDNMVTRCGSRGIYCEGGGTGTAVIGGNIVSDKDYDRGTVGVYLKTSRATLRWNTCEKKNVGVVALTGIGTPKWIPDLGRGALAAQNGSNRWLDNQAWYVWTGLLSPHVLYAEMNWHGTANPDPSKFNLSVDWDPALAGDPGSRGGVEFDTEQEYEYTLSQNRPNPFNPTTTIQYGVATPSRVTLRIYNMAGRLVRTLVDTDHIPGNYDVVWDGRNTRGSQLASSVYFALLSSSGETKTRKLILLK